MIWPDFGRLPSAEEPILKFHPFAVGDVLSVAGKRIEVLSAAHTVPAVGFAVDAGGDRWCVYTGDTGPTENIWRLMGRRRVKALIIEVSFPDEMHQLALASGHLTPSLLALEIQKMQTIPEKIYITHLKPFYRETIKTQLSKLSPPGIEILEDGMVFSL